MMSSRKHWTDLPVHSTHTWRRDGHCEGCMMHRSWGGSREPCTQPVAKKPKRARALTPVDGIPSVGKPRAPE